MPSLDLPGPKRAKIEEPGQAKIHPPFPLTERLLARANLTMASPIVTNQVFNLTTVDGGLNPASINFKNVTMESDKFICVRDSTGAQDPLYPPRFLPQSCWDNQLLRTSTSETDLGHPSPRGVSSSPSVLFHFFKPSTVAFFP